MSRSRPACPPRALDHYRAADGGHGVSSVDLNTAPQMDQSKGAAEACEPSSASEIVEELRAFWSFVRRAFGLPNAEECLGILDEQMAQTMKRELADPRNFGMAKSLVMGGMAAGFDMTTEEGMGAFTHAHNASLPAAALGPDHTPSRLRPQTQAEKNKRKAQRKAQRASRRKSR